MACAEPVLPVPLDTIDYELAFVVIRNESGVRALDPITPLSTSVPAWRRKTDDTVFVVAIAPGTLEVPGLCQERISEFALVVASTSPPPSSGLTRWTEIPLPEQTQVYAVRTLGTTTELVPQDETFEDLRLRVLVESEPGRPAHLTELMPFADREDVLAEHLTRQQAILTNVVWGDDERLVAAATNGLALVTENQPYVADPTRWIPTGDIPGNPIGIRDVAVSEPQADGSREVVAVGGYLANINGAQRNVGWAARARLDADGLHWFEEAVETRTDISLRSVVMQDNDVIAAGLRGLIFRWPIGDPPDLDPVWQDVDADVLRLATNSRPRTPLGAGAYGGVFAYDANFGQWDFDDVTRGVPDLERTAVVGLATNPQADTTQWWATTSVGFVAYRQDNQRWRNLELQYPRRFFECGLSVEDTQEVIYGQRSIRDVVIEGDYAFFAYEACQALVALRTDIDPTVAQPVSLLVPNRFSQEGCREGQNEPYDLSAQEDRRVSVAARRQQIVLASERGTILVARPVAP